MGMDIYGLNPKLKEEKPEIDYENSTEEERKEYWKKLNAWEEENPGYYFRANVWSWRPIQIIIETVKDLYELDIDTSDFGYNSGAGIDNQEKCNILADAIETFISRDQNFKEDSDKIYLNLGMWSSYEGQLYISAEVTENLNKDYPVGSVMYNPVVSSEGVLVVPAWSASKSYVENFVKFLRNCGGFEIW